MGVKDILTLADFEQERGKKLKVMESGQTRWACACGSTRFILFGDTNNTKAKCARCGNLDIIAWYPDINDSASGSVLDLRTRIWRKVDNKIHRRNLQIADLKRQLAKANKQ